MRRGAGWLLAGALAAAVGCTAAAGPAPDLVLVNGRVYTVDEAQPWVEAVAVTGDRISQVGTTADIRAMAGPGTRVIDLGGAFVSPGFNDGHVKFMRNSQHLMVNRCSGTNPYRSSHPPAGLVDFHWRVRETDCGWDWNPGNSIDWP